MVLRPPPESKCWDARRKMPRRGEREGWFRQAGPTQALRGLQEPRWRWDQHSARELGGGASVLPA